MINRLASALTLAAVVGVAAVTAAPVSFDFKDPKGVNAIQFHLDSVLEPISGTASGITGTVAYDPASPATTTGKIVVETASLKVPNDTMTDHLTGKNWLNAEANPEITFEITGLSEVKTMGDTVTATAHGNFSLMGVTKTITVPVKLTLLPGAFGKRINKPEVGGDLLVVRGEFTVDREAFGIQPGKNLDKVAKEIELSIAIVGGAPSA